ncbi:hypothetical protein K492DRAFT_212005 [Lichtheimia hyalospora FSU 10163]|nr:hypothetical protein K492DRAFT_212005 [Lichtheimia hyalospora FSU 10163]
MTKVSNEPTVSVKHKHHNNVITQSSIELKQCVDRQVELLHARAMALAACAQFYKALQDATTIQDLAPMSYVGYYAAGYIYMQCGKQEQAIQVLDQGLSVATDSFQHQKLQSAREEASTRLATRIDFISQLPLDIVSSYIIPHRLRFPSMVAFSYLHVCKTWRQRTLRSTMLRFEEGVTDMSSHLLDILTGVSPYIRHMTLSDFRGFPFGFLKTKRFDCLQSLKVELASTGDPRTLSDLFQHLGQTLEHVNLKTRLDETNEWIPLSTLLKYCPNMTSLLSNLIAIGESELPDEIYPKVKELKIKTAPQALGYQDIKTLLCRFPSLEYLALPYCTDAQALALIPEYCPSLCTLIYESHLHSILDSVNYRHGRNQSSLQALKINGTTTSLDEDEVELMMTTYRLTLRYAHVLGNMTPSTSTVPQHIQFHHLTALYLYYHDIHDGIEFFAWIINNAPNIQQLTIRFQEHGDRDVCQAMKHLRHLKQVRYEACSFDFIDFLKYHATLGVRSSLIILDVTANHPEVPELLSAIYRLSLLQTLRLDFNDDSMGHLSMQGLAEGCPSLESLSLECDIEIPSSIIYDIQLLPKLGFLYLSDYGDSVDCLISLLACKQVKTLEMGGFDLPDHIKDGLGSLLLLE